MAIIADYLLPSRSLSFSYVGEIKWHGLYNLYMKLRMNTISVFLPTRTSSYSHLLSCTITGFQATQSDWHTNGSSSLIYEVRQFNSRNGPVKAKFAYLCTSGCCRLRNTLSLWSYALRETMVPMPETVLKIVFRNTCTLVQYQLKITVACSIYISGKYFTYLFSHTIITPNDMDAHVSYCLLYDPLSLVWYDKRHSRLHYRTSLTNVTQ